MRRMQGPPPGGYGAPPPSHQYPYAMAPATPAMMFPPCRACGYAGPAYVATKTSSGGWVLFVVLFLILCWPLCWIPLVAMKDRLSLCAHCKVAL